jgi:hypothetical protein
VFLDPARGGALVFSGDTGTGNLDLLVHELYGDGLPVGSDTFPIANSGEDDQTPAIAVEPGTGLLWIAYRDAFVSVPGVSLIGVDLCR